MTSKAPIHGSARERFLAFRKRQKKAPPLTHRTVAARGLEFAVFTSPDVPGATPLLCVNGGLHFGHEVLWPALAPLSGNRQLIFFDQRGRGRTPPSPAPRTSRIEYDAGDATAIRRAMGLEKYDLLGHSWGGGIAMLAAADDSDSVDGLVLVDPVGPTSEWLSRLHSGALATLDGERHAALAAIDPTSLQTDDLDTHAAYTSALYPAWFSDRRFGEIFSSPRAHSATGAAVSARLRRDGYDWTDRIATIRARTLIAQGEDDLIEMSVAESLSKLIPNSELAVIPHAGHMPFWEAPEEFFGRVETFLAR